MRQTHASFGANVINTVSVTRNTTNTKSLVVDLVPFALRAFSLNWVVTNYAAAFAVGKDFIDTTASDTEVSTFSVAVRT